MRFIFINFIPSISDNMKVLGMDATDHVKDALAKTSLDFLKKITLKKNGKFPLAMFLMGKLDLLFFLHHIRKTQMEDNTLEIDFQIQTLTVLWKGKPKIKKEDPQQSIFTPPDTYQVLYIQVKLKKPEEKDISSSLDHLPFLTMPELDMKKIQEEPELKKFLKTTAFQMDEPYLNGWTKEVFSNMTSNNPHKQTKILS